MRELTGRFHLTFYKPERFVNALGICYLGDKVKRCWALIPDEDSLYVIQPSKSTERLNILVLEDIDKLNKKVREDIKAILRQEKIEIIWCAYIRRPPQAKGFIVGFRKPGRFVNALTILYLGEKTKRCRVITPDGGDLLIIQPKPSTPELNTLILEDFDKIGEEEKEKIETAIKGLEIIECAYVGGAEKTSNY